MNAKVEEFLNLKKDEEKKRRDEHLVSLGLIDESKTVRGRKYSQYWKEGYERYDGDKDMYFCETEVYAPLEVTDEEYNEILKYAPENVVKCDVEKTSGTNWGGVIKVMAYIYLIVGVIANLFLLSEIHKPSDFDFGAEAELAREAAEQAQAECIIGLIFIIISFPFVMGLSRIVSAAEKYLRK